MATACTGPWLEVASQPMKCGRFVEADLVHIERAIDLDLQDVLGLVRPAVMLGDITAGIRLVQDDDVAQRLELAAASRINSPLHEVPNRSPSTKSGRPPP